MESTSIELKVKSCKDVRAFNFFQKLSVYALVSIVSDDPNKKLERNQRQRTPTNRVDGDGNPEWNQKMHFDLNEVWGSDSECDHNLFFHFELRHEGMVFGDKTIGEVRVPFKDLIQDSNAATGVVRFVSYQVRTGDGKPNGVLNFSYKLFRNGEGKASKTDSTASSVNQITCYPTVDDHQQQQSQDHEIRYPPMEVSEESLSFSTPQQVDRSLSSGTPAQYSPHQTNYYTPPPPPPPDAYYPRPPPPPPDAYYLPPPPPPMPHEACHHHHHHPPHPHRPWAPNSFWNGR